MASKETDQMLEDELQALHQSIEQLNSGSSGTSYQIATVENRKPNRRKRVNQTDVHTQTPRKSTKRKMQVTEKSFHDPDNPIDEILEDIAQRKNLTTNNVKHLLRNIIANESVQEMLKCSLDSTLKMSFEPKLTRSKTKEWLETQNLSWPPSAKKVSETQILMTEDFPEDSSDDEYRPNEEDTDNHSDEESFVSSQTSDIGSPMSSLAPLTPNVLQTDDTFKRPFPIEQPSLQDDLIGFRTRSKLPLNDTPLEHLELAFVPPDISTDMYDSDCDNEEWRKFLKEFVCPPSHHSVENVDDEEADPEYNVLEEEEEVDDEEMRADRTVQITKKEVSELLSELFEEDFSSSDEEPTQFKTNATPSQQQNEDILQTAMSDLIAPLESNTSGISKVPGKPTGIVQPLPATHEPLHNVAFTVSFPTMECPTIEVFTQPLPTSSDSQDVYSQPTIELSYETKLLLSEQMRKHVQLLTQMHLITAQQSTLAPVTEECRLMLQDLLAVTNKIEIANLEEALDLVSRWEEVATKTPADELRRFQRTVVTSGGKKKFFKRSCKHPDRYPFNSQMVELMAESRVFIYPELLPKLAIFQAESGPCRASVHEEQLIAMGLEQFTPFCTDLLKGSRGSVEKLVCSMISHYMLPHWNARQIVRRIRRMCLQRSPANPVKYYLENKVAPPIYHVIQPFDRYSMKRLCEVPPSLLPERWRELMVIHEGVHHRSQRKTPFALRPSVSRVSSCLPAGITPLPELVMPASSPDLKKRKPWVCPRRKAKEKKQTNCISQPQLPVEQASHSSHKTIASPEQTGHLESENPSSPYIVVYSNQVPTTSHRKNVFYDEGDLNSSGNHSDDKQETENEETEPTASSETCAIDLEKVTKQTNSPVIPSSEDTNETEASRDDSAISSESVDTLGLCSKSLHVTDSDSDAEFHQPVDASSPNEKKKRACPSLMLGAKRYVLIQRPDTNAEQIIHVWGPQLNSQSSLPVRNASDHERQGSSGNKDTSSKKTESTTTASSSRNSCYLSANSRGVVGAGSGGDDGDKPPSSPVNGIPADDNTIAEEDEEEEDNLSLDLLTILPSATLSAPSKGRSPAHRQIRHQRNAKRILDSWMADDDPSQPRSDAYAQMYFMKVRSRLEQQNPLAFKEFVTTLGHFQSNTSSTLELYQKIESILKDHSDLMEEFVLFLSPEVAAQCGVQFQHFLYVRMREFFSKLKIHFKDSPSQLKRTLKTLQQIESSSTPNVNDIKNAILPLLKGNAHLTQAFLQLFPDDAPPPSDSGDFEDINMDQINSGDEFEYVHFRETAVHSKEGEIKTGKRTGNKGSAKNKSKGKAWKKST